MTKKRKNAIPGRHQCAWCGKQIPRDHEVFGLSAKAPEGFDPTGYEGTIMPLPLPSADKIVPVIVTGKDSPARKEGKDFVFMLCSIPCAESLKAALLNEKSIVREIVAFHQSAKSN